MLRPAPSLPVLGLLLMAGCATAPPPSPTVPEGLPEATKQLMEAACGAAVAQHIRAPETAVLPVWSGATPDNRGLVTVGDTVTGQQRVHFCEVSAEGRVYAIRQTL